MTPLSERLAALTGPDHVMNDEVSKLFHSDKHGNWVTRSYTSDLNAVVAEVERRGWRWAVGISGSNKQPWADVYGPPDQHQFLAPTPCLALLLALVAAVKPAETAA